jgi:sugar phosphate isomerase/epimerase
VRQVGKLGYEGVEFAGYGGLSADEITALLAETGLRVAGTHVGLAALEKDLEGEIDYCLAIGSPYLVLPWLPEELRGDVATISGRLNEFGRRCKERGLSFGYHNHDWEFTAGDDGYFMDRLLDATDPALVGFELDLGWAAYAGADPIAILRERSGRISLVHVKDFGRDGESVDVGEGVLELGSILPVAQEAGVQWYIVENDRPQGPSIESARRSLESLRAAVV